MSRKHIDIDEPTPAPAFIRTVLTGTLDMRIGGAKPQVRLVQTSSGYEVVFEAHGETRGRWFEHLGQAQRYFERLTGRTSSFEYTSRREIVRRAAGATLGVVAAALIGCVASASLPAAAQTNKMNTALIPGTCGPLSHTAEGPLGSDLTKRRSRFYCNAAVISEIGDYPGHFIIQFGERGSHHNQILGFAGRMESKDAMQVEHAYLQPGVQSTVSDGECQFVWGDDRNSFEGIACGMKLDETGRRTVAIVSFDAKR